MTGMVNSNLEYLDEAMDELDVGPAETLVMMNQILGYVSGSVDPETWRVGVDRAVVAIRESRAARP